jgi:hypothetical protein
LGVLSPLVALSSSILRRLCALRFFILDFSDRLLEKRGALHCARAASPIAAGDGRPAKRRRHTTTSSPFTVAGAQPPRAQQRSPPTISARYSTRVWNLVRQPRRVAAGRVENPPLPGSPIPHSPSPVHHSLFAIRHSPFFTIRHSPSPTIRPLSPLATRHSLLAVFHHPPFAIRNSLFCLARPGRWVSRNGESRVKRRGSRISGEGPASAQGSGEVGLFENRRNSSERRANGAGLLVAKPARQLRLWILGFPGVAVASAPGASRRLSLDQ